LASWILIIWRVGFLQKPLLWSATQVPPNSSQTHCSPTCTSSCFPSKEFAWRKEVEREEVKVKSAGSSCVISSCVKGFRHTSLLCQSWYL
jgi:hypothetical protein